MTVLRPVEGEGNPYYREMIEELEKVQKEGKVRAAALVTIEGETIFCDWVKNDGTSLCELLGAVVVLQQDLLEKMKV